MDSSKIKALLKAIDSGSLTKASESLGYTQSGLTHMMNSIEKEIGFKILKRGREGVKLTDEGERLLPLLRQFVKLDNKIQEEINLIKKQINENLRIGAYASISKHWLPIIIGKFQKHYPKINFDIRLGGMDELAEMLRNEEIDFCFMSDQLKNEFDFIPLKEDKYMAVLYPQHPYAGMSSFPLEKLNGETFIMPSYGKDNDIRAVLDKNGINPLIRTASVDDPAVISMVAHGLGISILSELVLKGNTENLVILPLNPCASRILGIALNSLKKTTPMVKRFIELAKTIPC
ncbi:MAG TPA: LysR family transcriptional regulator [Firmicutes bacterium]|nr:LysR family transcriptional regulator [Bacillota bacterium]